MPDDPNVDEAEQKRQQGEDQIADADAEEEEARRRSEEEKNAIDQKYGTY